MEQQTMTPTPTPSKPPSYHDDFINQGRYLRAWSPRTVRTYRQGLRALAQTPLTKAGLHAWVVGLRERGLTRGGVNMYIRTVNSFLSWLHEEGHVPERLRLKLLPNPPGAVTSFTDAEVRRIITYRPTNAIEKRTLTLVVVLFDTGVRIDEALGVQRADVNLDGLMIRVMGKGHRERLVPISAECRRHLYRHLSHTTGDHVFSTRTNRRLSYRNVYDDIKALCRAAGVEGAHVHPHNFRHAFAASYIRNGGDIYRLSRILGHSTITTTQLYLRSMGIEHLQEGHAQFSLIGNLAQQRVLR
jgi:integrase/recombinase XerD